MISIRQAPVRLQASLPKLNEWFKMATDLEQLIRSLTGSADSHLPLQSDPTLSASLRLIRILGVSKCADDTTHQGSSLESRQRSFYSGLFGSGQPFVFIARGVTIPKEELQVFVGLPQITEQASDWESALQAIFPGCDTGDGPQFADFMREIQNEHPLAAAMSGSPSIPPTQPKDKDHSNSSGNPAFEDFLSCMSGTEWAYVLMANPVERSVIEQGIFRLAANEKAINSNFLRKGTAEEGNNPLAKQAIDLIVAYKEKYLAGRAEGMWDVKTFLLAKSRSTIDRAIHAAYSAFSGPFSTPRPIRVQMSGYEMPTSSLDPIEVPFLLTATEVAALARFPDREFPGFRVRDQVRFALSPPDSALKDTDSRQLLIGTILDERRRTGIWYGLDMDSLCKHSFVAGVPGQGKTHTCFYLLHQLWEKAKIPWLVLEPSSKSEYRQLLASDTFKDVLRVFTCGHEGIAPIRINPLEVMPGVHVQTQIDNLQTLLNSAFAWVPPMPTVLNKALHRVYKDKGWDLAFGTHPNWRSPESQPTLDDLILTVDKLCSELGYSAEVTGNIRAGLQTRLSSLTEGGKGLMLNCRTSIPMQTLLAQPTVLELAAIGDDDDKAFVLGVILLKLAQFRQSEGLSRKGLRHVTVVEEAHRLLRAVPETVGTETANSRGKLIEAFCNILAEFRAYGEGIVVVDQIPEKLAPDVIKNTNLKLVHRLVAEGDRKLVGGAMNLTESQQRFLATLRPGQAVVYSENREYPYLVQIPNHAEHRNYKDAIMSNGKIHNHMSATCGLMPAHRSSLDGRMPDGCACPGRCTTCSPSLQKRILTFLIAEDHADAYRNAVSQGWHGMWAFAIGVAQSAGFQGSDLSQAAFCLLMQLVVLGKCPDDIAEKTRVNVGILRDSDVKSRASMKE